MSGEQGSVGHLSAKMMEAQAYFQKVVKHELQVLVASGLEREVAVKVLLHRIVESTQEPEESDVKRVMRQFQMNYDDAVRALIVKQEIGRLKRQGLDAFAAIEELTRKMHRISVPDKQSEEEEKDSVDAHDSHNESMEDPAASDESSESSDSSTQDEEAPDHVVSTEETEITTVDTTADQKNDTADTQVAQETVSAEAKETETTQESTYLSSLSLCQRIDQVSISASSPEAAAATSSSPPASPSSSLSTSRPSESNTAFTLFSAHSRKRRVTSALSSPAHEDDDDEPTTPQAPSSSTAHRSHFAMARPMSPTFRFSMNKKQKIWTEDEESEPFFDSVAFKTSSIPPPASPTAVSTSSDAPNPSNTATPTKVGKRRRSVHTAGSIPSPELDEIDAEDPMIRVKRHKL